MELLEYYNLKDHPGIDLIEYGTEDEWLEERAKGIGGSDAAAVLGMSKYTSPLKLYRIKLGELKQDLSDNVYVKKGKDLEAMIRNQYVAPRFAEMGYTVVHPQQIFVSKKTPWLRANCDAIAVPIDPARQTFSENIIIEIKWVSEWGEANWYGEDYLGVPPEYYAQVQHYMLTTGARKAVICALFDKSWEMHYFEIPFDVKFAEHLSEETYKFYNFHMMMKIPPKVDAIIDKEDALELLKKDTVETIVGDPLFENLLTGYMSEKADANFHTKNADALMKQISALYLEGHRSETYRMNIGIYTRVGFNTAKFAEDHPELYEQYLQTSEYTRTTVKRK
jgi:putative phage-type endonuclease